MRIETIKQKRARQWRDFEKRVGAFQPLPEKTAHPFATSTQSVGG